MYTHTHLYVCTEKYNFETQIAGDHHYVRAEGAKYASFQSKVDRKWEDAHRSGSTEVSRWVPAEALEIAREYWSNHMKGASGTHMEALLYILNSVWNRAYETKVRGK